MSFTLPVGAILSKKVKLTGNTATTLLTATGRVTVLSIYAAETNGGTQNLTVDVTNGTTTWYLRNAKALTAKELVTIETIMVLENGESLRATSSDASGHIDLFITYSAFDIAGRGSPGR